MSNRGLSKKVDEQTFCHSDTAIKYGIVNVFENQIVFNNAVLLCRDFIDAIYQHYLRGVVISSGYRCTVLNAHKKIKGAPNSAHRFGNAADITVKGITPKQLFNDIISGKIRMSDGKPMKDFVDQCIYEEKGNSKWVHIQRAGKPRKQFMFSPDGSHYQTVTKQI